MTNRIEDGHLPKVCHPHSSRIPFTWNRAAYACLLVAAVLLLAPAATASDTEAGGWQSGVGIGDASRTIHEKSRPLDASRLEMVGARNGSATGVLLVRGGIPVGIQNAVRVRELRHTQTRNVDLAGDVLIVYASRRRDHGPENGHVDERLPYFDTLLPVPPDGDAPLRPVYLHLPIPADATPGTYEGEVQIAAGRGTATVPIRLRISAYRVPPPPERRGWVDMLQSPDTIAYRYGVRLYSREHLRLLEPSMKMLGNLGSRVMHVPVLARTNFGNDESMIPMDRGGIDFSGFEAYLSMFLAHVGVPCRVILYVDEGGHTHAPNWTPPGGARDGTTEAVAAAYDDAHKATWQALMDGLRERLDRAGVPESSILLGWIGDNRSYQDRVAYWNDVAPYARWVQFTHARGDPRPGDESVMNVAGMPVAYRVLPYPPRVTDGMISPGHRGWDNPFLELTSVRHYNRVDAPIPNFRAHATVSVQHTGREPTERNYRGFARLGLDFWPLWLPNHEEPRYLLKRFHRWHNLQRDTAPAITAAGPEGALPTVRYLNLWEGIQENEARLLVEATMAQVDNGNAPESDEAYRGVLDAWKAVRRANRGRWSNPDDDPDVTDDGVERVFALFEAAAAIQGE